MKNKCWLILFLIAVMLTSSACGGETVPSAEDTTASETLAETETEQVFTLPEADYNGEEFTFLNGNVSYTYASVVATEQTGETMNDAIYQRNSAVEERYNIKIGEVITNDPQADYKKSVTTGDNSFDIALLRMEWAFPAVLENTVLSWDNIPYLQLEQDWWVQGSIESMSLMNKVYFAVSQFDTSHFESVRGFVYNKNMAEDLQLPSLYTLVREGKWTLDVFYDMCTKAAVDLDGNGKFTNNDCYGVATYPNVFGNTLMCGVGSILSIGKDKDDIPFFDLDSETHINNLIDVTKLFENKNGFMSTEQPLFKSGQSLFRCCLMSEITSLRDMEDDFGILPAPKRDEEQKEYYNLGGSPFFMVVPNTAKDLERTGIMMEALAMESMGLIDTAYYDTILMGKTSRDEESVEMLALIFSTLDYYHPLANSYLNAPMTDKYICVGNADYASYFASVRDLINKDIETAIATFTANTN